MNMEATMQTFRREALAAPTDASSIHIQSVVILIVSIASLLGAAWIIVSFIIFENLRSFRHHLILGLAISDFLMAVNFLSSTAMNISGKYIGSPEQSTFCSFNGFVTQVFVIQTDYWVFVIALCTYVILADHKRMSEWVQDQQILLSCLPWIFSLLWAGIGLKLAGYGDIGAWCWFTSDKVRLLANFVPRWIIIVSILGMYAQLYFVLRRAHSRFTSSEDTLSNNISAPTTTNNVSASTRAAANRTEGTSYNGSRHRHIAEKSAKRLRMVARLMVMYPLAYMLIWTLPTAVRIYQTSQGSPAPFTLQTVDKSCIVLQGFIDAVIYGLNESSWSSWRNLLFPPVLPNDEGGDRYRSTSITHRVRNSAQCTPLDDAVPNDSVSSFGIRLSKVESTRELRGPL